MSTVPESYGCCEGQSQGSRLAPPPGSGHHHSAPQGLFRYRFYKLQECLPLVK